MTGAGDAPPATPARIAILGAWHLGLITAGCIADRGNHVTVYDADPATLEGLRAGRLPLYEPGLDDLIAAQRAAGRLDIASSVTEAVAGATHVWIAADTPLNDRDEADLSGIEAMVDELADALPDGATVLVSSQVPLGTCDAMVETIRARQPGRAFGLCYVPENLRLGHGIARFQKPDMLVLGVDAEATVARVESLLSVIEAPRVVTTLKTAEMVKHALNGFLATSITFANEIGNLSDALGADAHVVARALKLDTRIGPGARLVPGLAFSGGTLARDSRTLHALGERTGTDTLLIDAVIEVNARQNRWVARTLERVLGPLAGRRVAILGLTYTVGTSTLRRSAAVEVARELRAAGVEVTAADPQADAAEFAALTGVTPASDAYGALSGADAAVLMTAWPEFQSLDLARVAGEMARPLVLDPQGVLQADALRAAGIEHIVLGTGAVARVAGEGERA